MNIHIPVNPTTGQTSGVVINGDFVALGNGNHQAAFVADRDMPVRQKPGFLSIPLAILCGMRDFAIGALIYRPQGCTGPIARLNDAYLDKVRASKGMDPLTRTAPGAVVKETSPGTTSSTAGGATVMEKILERSKLLTHHATHQTANGTKVRLTFFPSEKKVERRVGVLVTNVRGKPALNYIPVRPLLRNSFSDDFPFCETNALLLTKRDINEGLLKGFLELGTLPGRGVTTEMPTAKTVDVAGQDPAQGASELNLTKFATGQVIKMETVSKQFGDKPAYQTFVVVIRKPNAEEVDFNGKQLEEKAAAGLFKLGDIISIGQGKVAMRRADASGKTIKTSSNSFDIKVIQAAV